MATDRTSWGCLPPEVRNQIIHLLPKLGGRCSQLVTVCKAWQSIIEPLNFAKISLTVPRLADLNSQAILFQKRHLIRYIWFRVELKQYDCTQCTPIDRDIWDSPDFDNEFNADAFESLFTTLSAWEPRGDLVLDISVYSPSDNQHWFKYLSFCPDTDLAECPLSHGQVQGATLNDPAHGWVAGQQVLAPPPLHAMDLPFEEIMDQGPFEDEESEMEWWRDLPIVPVVGVVLLRQQTRRRWNPVALSNMFTRFPNMKELCYEPWREFTGIETQTDERNQTLMESFFYTKLCKLTIFENFNEAYPKFYPICPAIRVPNPAVSQKLARASLHLTMLSASFMADAGHFFEARQGSWTWDKLTSLALTSRILTDDPDPLDIDSMLRDAAAAALKMPRLDTMELWNGRRGLAMLFRYQRAQYGQPATITVRGTSELVLGRTVMPAWDVVARQHCHGKIVVQSSLIDPDGIRCHGDAIRQLGLSTEVVRPVSLRRILSEHWDPRYDHHHHYHHHQQQHVEELAQ